MNTIKCYNAYRYRIIVIKTMVGHNPENLGGAEVIVVSTAVNILYQTLIGVVFVGAAIGVAKNNHIQVDLLYRWLPRSVARALATAVDLLRVLFFGAMVVLTAQMMQKMGSYQMTIVDLPMNIVYGVCLFGFAMMAVRSVWVMKVHVKRGYSVLERPETTMYDR